MQKMIDDDNDAIAYDAYIKMMHDAKIDDINEDMIEFDAIIEICDLHDDGIEIDASFLIAHHEYSNHAIAHYAIVNANENACKCIEFCAYHEECHIEYCNK